MNATVMRYLGPWVAEPQLWQDPVSEVDHELVGDPEVEVPRQSPLDSGLSLSQLVPTRVGLDGELPANRQARRGERRPPSVRGVNEVRSTP